MTIENVDGLDPEHAVLVGRFGHLGIKDGAWPLLGRALEWDRSTWPMPVFVRYEELTGRTLHVHYDDDDPNHSIGNTPVPPGLAEHGPRDGLMGAGYVEITLAGLLKVAR